MKYHFNYPTWCPFTSFLFFLTQNADQLVPEERREENHVSLSASQQQLIKRDIWRQLRDIFGGVDSFYGLNVVNHMKVFSLMMTLQSSVTLPQNKAASTNKTASRRIVIIHLFYLFMDLKKNTNIYRVSLYKAENSWISSTMIKECVFLRLFLSHLPLTQISEILAFLNPQSGLTLLGQSGQRMLSEASPGAKISP